MLENSSNIENCPNPYNIYRDEKVKDVLKVICNCDRLNELLLEEINSAIKERKSLGDYLVVNLSEVRQLPKNLLRIAFNQGREILKDTNGAVIIVENNNMLMGAAAEVFRRLFNLRIQIVDDESKVPLALKLLSQNSKFQKSVLPGV